jgi:hypothetical protein
MNNMEKLDSIRRVPILLGCGSSRVTQPETLSVS